MRLGIICPSEIAIRRFMPALLKCNELTFAGIGVYTKEEFFLTNNISDEDFQKSIAEEINKAQAFVNQYGGRIYNGYEAIATSLDVDALYIPLPPALHFKWAKIALEHGKHVLVEKPATISAADTKELVKIAAKKELTFHENYMFMFHEQLNTIENIVKNGELGKIRLYRISFGFPMRAENDFRYNKALGGGALIDAGGYTIRYAMRLLGPSTSIRYAQSNYIVPFEVDMYGSAALVNDDGVTAQVAFGMDNNYKCELEVWGSEGCLRTGRVLTAPPHFVPTAIICKGNENNMIELPADDAFFKSICHFIKCVNHEETRKEGYKLNIKQAELVDDFKCKAGWQ